ncbi:DUF2461 domain-containing protein [Solitalea canadensis]|nr:DUF2461 domain-containing protein [Solitalea canadensis]
MLHQTTFDFLAELAINNNREWFMANKPRYETARKNVEELVDAIIKKLATIDPAVAGLTGKKSVMRIYRDVRFSKDKSPYKKNFGIVLGTTEKGVNGPCYYLHVEPGQCFVAGGYWMPPADHVKAIRQEIDYNTEEFKSIIGGKGFKQYFKELDVEEKLKTAPKGYPSDHPDIELLKLKSYTASTQLNAKELLDNKVVDKIVNIFSELFLLNQFLQNAISS